MTRGEWRTHGRAAAVVTTRSHIGGAVRGRLSAAQHRRVGTTLAYVKRLLHRQYVHARTRYRLDRQIDRRTDGRTDRQTGRQIGIYNGARSSPFYPHAWYRRRVRLVLSSSSHMEEQVERAGGNSEISFSFRWVLEGTRPFANPRGMRRDR